MRTVRGISLAALISFLISSPLRAEQPTPAEMVAGYQQNQALFAKSRFSWHRIERTGDYYARQRLREEKLDPTKKGKLPLMPGEDQLVWHWQELRTDGKCFQIRMPGPVGDPPPFGLVGPNAADWKFSNEPVTPTTLLSVYGGYRIFSYCAGGGTTTWEGLRSDGTGNGWVSNLPINAQIDELQVPPLCPATIDWGKARHPIDKFFQLPLASMENMGPVEIQGKQTLLLESRQVLPGLRRTPQDGNVIDYVRMARAWIAPELGWLPYRVEFTWDLVQNGKSLSEGRKRQPGSVVVEVQAIAKIPGAGFYPIKGVDSRNYPDGPVMIRRSAVDPPTAPVTAERMLANLEMEVVLCQEFTWAVDEITPLDADDEKSFVIRFPEKMAYYDAVRDRTIIPADREQEPSK